jgi:hypothetical protein
MNDQAVAQHYSRGGLEQQVLDVLTTIGADLEHLDSDQLASVDEFHIGGRSATVELVNQLNLRPGLRVLDVGSGVGGYCPLSDVMRVGPGDLTFPCRGPLRLQPTSSPNRRTTGSCSRRPGSRCSTKVIGGTSRSISSAR